MEDGMALDPTDFFYDKALINMTQNQNDKKNNQRVLLVEDCEHTRALLANMLRKLGLQVTSAADGESFVEHAMGSEAEGSPFDLVLLDINLPKLNGVEATKILRKSGYERPIIAITAGPSLQDRNDSIYAGCDNFLAKSELHITLAQTLKNYLNLSQP